MTQQRRSGEKELNSLGSVDAFLSISTFSRIQAVPWVARGIAVRTSLSHAPEMYDPVTFNVSLF